MESNTWTWHRAHDYEGTVALILVDSASMDDLHEFADKTDGYPVAIYRRPARHYWDGYKMTPDELEQFTREPLKLYRR